MIRTLTIRGAMLAAGLFTTMLPVAMATAAQAQNKAPAAPALAAPAPAAGTPKDEDGEHGSAETGKRVFMAVGCWECHGTAGQGGNATGPQIGPDPLPFAAFLQQLRHPSEDMPPFGKAILSDAEAADIRAYLAGQKKVSAKDIPLLRN